MSKVQPADASAPLISKSRANGGQKASNDTGPLIKQQWKLPDSGKVNVDTSQQMVQLKQIIQRFNEKFVNDKRSIGFSFDKSLGVHVITVRDTRSGEVIRQLPSEEVVRVAHNIEKLKGLLFDRRA
ncbi:MAG: flagellar protein FlaG [Burkholderiales bacterium]|nr:flagellar protein FlaG [Burkholderiales bacterium]